LSLGRSTVRGIQAGALSVPGVVGAQVTSNINPFTGTLEPNWVAVYVTDGTSAPPASLLTEVRRVIEGDTTDPVNYPGYAAAGARVFVGAINVTPVNLVYELWILDESPLTEVQARSLLEAAVTSFVNTQPPGRDIVHAQLIARALGASGDFYTVQFSPPGDLVVPASTLARIGGTGGGTITCTAVHRVIPP
jgi:Baseplate J-like protein